jgi:phage gp46-like protein
MDIALFFEKGQPNSDIQIEAPGLAINKDLQSAVIISLFANRLAQSGDQFDGTDRHGWWGDTFATVNGSLIGSRLWELKRAKQLQSVANLARQYCLEALQWLIEDQVAASVDVQAEIIAMYTLGIGVQIFKPDGGFQSFKFEYVWSQI